MRKAWDSYKFCFYLIVHPIDGFQQLKYGGKGRFWVAFLNFMLLWVSFSFNAQYSSLVVNQRYPMNYNSLMDGGMIFAMLILWCIANWSVTSLTGGEGKFKEILMFNCYAFIPLILTFIPATLLSNVLAEGEGAFYSMILSAAMFIFLFLAFIGMITVHNYTVVKAVITILLTIGALLIILFLFTLLFTLYQQLYVFIYSIYTELRFRY
jgi:hypothetical protein